MGNPLKFVILLFTLALACSGSINADTNPVNAERRKVFSEDSTINRKSLVDLSQKEILDYAQRNSCYYTLLKDPDYFNMEYKAGFEVHELYNRRLSKTNPFRNRFLVADLMALNDSLLPRGISEMNPVLGEIIEFENADSTFFTLLDQAENSPENEKKLFDYIRENHSDDSSELFNFYNQVWKYKTPPLSRTYARDKGRFFAAGQRICLCEAREDTLVRIAQFAVSSKRIRSLPVGRRRSYYASLYEIGSKNWERKRKYTDEDARRDKELGGGGRHVTYYKGKVELPNFLLMKPDTLLYPGVMLSNGIHEVALRNLARGMLGCANSIGCIRVSDFGSKFIRWWVPMKANFFIIYKDDRYFKELDALAIQSDLPFANETEGNNFRNWLITKYPLKAEQLDIDSTGDYDNGYILDAFNLYGEEYTKESIEKND